MLSLPLTSTAASALVQGFCANSLELGCDCLGVIKYFDAILNDAKGRLFRGWVRVALTPAFGGGSQRCERPSLTGQPPPFALAG
jgi:hypothetical protein